VAAVHYVDLKSTNSTPPYTNWTTAATNIQDAVDAAVAGDEIVVTNGTYASGGRNGDRVEVNKPLALRGINGPQVTTIDGGGSVRCVYLTNNASLSGFTLTGGSSCAGAGVYCSAASAVVSNCVVKGNHITNPCYPSGIFGGDAYGGGAYGGTLNNCTLANNSAQKVGLRPPGAAYGGGAYGCILNNCTLSSNSVGGYALVASGGGAHNCTLNNCTLSGNSAGNGGGGASGSTLNDCTLNGNSGGALSSTLNNCTLTGNSCGAYSSTLNNCALTGNLGYGAYSCGLTNCTLTANSNGVYNCTLDNCVAYFNNGFNYDSSSSLSYCCTTPLPTNGVGNISSDPQLASASHLSALSPCIGKGSYAAVSGTDIDGEPWANPPSMGCDEYHAGAVTGLLSVAISQSYTKVTTNFAVQFTAWIDGRTVASSWDFADGRSLTNEPYASHAWTTPGEYSVVLRAFNESNPGGISATVTVQVVTGIHYAAANSANPVAPYETWATAATNIKDAIAAATEPGTVVIMVTNGTYSPIAASGPVSVRSVNGAQFTIIDGGNSNQCASLWIEASLSGFTLTNGSSQYGGGASGGTLNDCTLIGNLGTYGGGAYFSTLNNCALTGNSGDGAYACVLNNCLVTRNQGGGAYFCTLNDCALTGNSGLGAYQSILNNCTLTGNMGGATDCAMTNCIVYFNTSLSTNQNYDASSTLSYCCTTPLPTNGVGNISLDPQLASAWRLSATSPCRGAGNAAEVKGTDLDGEAWADPPSIGCDEYNAGALTGPLSVAITASYTNVAVGFAVQLTGFIDGRAAANSWDFGDGITATNEPYVSHAWSAPGDYVVVCRAYNESLPGGVSATFLVHVAELIHYVSANSANPVAPYMSWSSAARNIQDAVDAAAVPGALVLVTNGIYATGGSTTNRVTIDKPVILRSVNGPQSTAIDGGRAVRCVYLAGGANLSGFTVTNGSGAIAGGGIWCASDAEVVSNCVVAGNVVLPSFLSWSASGGGIYGGTLNNCALFANSASGGLYDAGGGAYSSTLNNCTLTGNSADGGYGGGAYSCTLSNCTLTGNSAVYGGGASDCTLNNCTLSNNWGSGLNVGGGGGASGSTLNNCTLSSNSAWGLSFVGGGGASQSTLNNCTLIGNSVTASNYSIYNIGGGGAFDCTVRNCTLIGNSAMGGGGGGASSCALGNCVLSGNYAEAGGGAFDCTVRNCALSGNRASGGGAAYETRLINCTVTGNWATNYGGGAYACGLTNSIVYFNHAMQEANYDSSSTLSYCCATPQPLSGTGNISADPQLASASHLSAGSPCRGAANAAYATGTDIDGEAWANPPSMGCDEYHVDAVTGPLNVALAASFTNVAVGFSVQFTATIDGRAAASSWDFGDGITVSNEPYASHAWTTPGDYVVVLRAYNDNNPGGVSASVLVHVVAQPTHYVSANAGSPVAPYTSWATAARTIQDAVDAATVAGALVLVTNGTYATGSRLTTADSTTNRLVVNKPLILLSANGPLFTTIDGGRAFRCVYLADSASMSGFTLTKGISQYGCGASGGTLNNCVLTGNSTPYGGAAYESKLFNCSLTGNSGNGAYFCTLTNCTLSNNSGEGASVCTLSSCNISSNSWTGADGCTLTNCQLIGNAGSGAGYSTLNNCILSGNSGGGAYDSTLNNCALTGNSANYGGGAADCTLNNCTLTGNSAIYQGGGAYSCALNNCIVYFNDGPQGANYDPSSTLNYCCTMPLPTNGVGNISSDPQLASTSHLSGGSPCRGAGNAAYASGTDIDGESWLNPPSIGCDEYHADALTGPLSVSISASFTNVAVGFPLQLTAWNEGRIAASVWDFGDGVTATNQPYTSHAWTTPGDYVVLLRAFNESNPGGISATFIVHVLAQPVHYVAPDSPNPVAPYASWATAATNIQHAVDAATVPGALVLVTNGTYSSGRRTIDGWTTNRLVVDKLLTVQSVNGPQSAIIDGSRTVRCVYLINGASLSGFTLTNGTVNYGGAVVGGMLNNCTLSGNSAGGNGGAAYSSALVNCTLTGNSASQGGAADNCTLTICTLTGNLAGYGGGAYGGVLESCALRGNSATFGGGAYACTLDNCTLTGNTNSGASSCTLSNCTLSGNVGVGADSSTLANCRLTGNTNAGAWGCALKNCALTDNSGFGAGSSMLTNCTLTGNSGGGAYASTLNNCIVYFNSGPQAANYDSSSTLNYCCTTPQPTNGVGNISSDPQLASAYHLSASSPCRAAGNAAYASGTDIDGEAWLNPPSIGCDEYHAGAVTGPLSVAISASLTSVLSGFTVQLEGLTQGRTTGSSWDFGDGTAATNQPFIARAWTALGDYIVAFRAYNESQPGGVSATVTIHVVPPPIHYVAADSANPLAPYTSWATAATNIQDAVDAATVPGALVLVTNGLYATGGRGTSFGISRVAVDKLLGLRSVNGPRFTTIRGLGGLGDCGRCVSLSSGASLSGFTLTNGCASFGGGVRCESASEVVSNCVITGNSTDSRAYSLGGGAYGGTLNNCTLSGNSADNSYGGGAYGSVLNNCALIGNANGGAGGCTLTNCTLTGNSGPGASGCALNNCALSGNTGVGASSCALTNCTLTGNSGGGATGSTLNNCIVYFNTAHQAANYDSSSTLNYCCTTPQPASGIGNISSDPQLASASHLSASSPCRGAGNAAWVSGTDIDGEVWLNPPSIGCDEYHAGAVTGPLSVGIAASFTSVVSNFTVQLEGSIQGRTTGSSWDFGDGTAATNQPYAAHAWTALGDYIVAFRAYNESQPGGVSATVTIHVVVRPVHYVAADSTNPVAPYTSWSTAATNIQDAVDAAAPGAMVLVTNGTYGGGVAVSKLLTLGSVNGPKFTVIDGGHSNRCVSLTRSASLSGFTLTNGSAQYGGGVYCESANEAVSNCVVVGNLAYSGGGGAYGGTLDDCTLSSNSVYGSGGGAAGSTLTRCTLKGNSAFSGIDYVCRPGGGGGCYYVAVNSSGGGASGGTLNSCLLSDNRALAATNQYGHTASGYGGGASSATLINCTLTGNSASGYNYYPGLGGGGASACQLNNCIVFFNTAPGLQGPNYDSYCTLNYCCTTPQPNGFGNIADAPLFVDLAGGSLRLQSNSPCINAGNNSYLTNSYFTNSLDLDGNPRVSGGTVDIGAYEFQNPSSTVSYAWLENYGFATDGSADHADPDGDGVPNYQEWLDGSDPTNALSSRPVIWTQPASQRLNLGDNVTFTVTATGTGPLACQWFFNQTNSLPGATNLALVVSNVQRSSAGAYSALLSNVFASVLSSNAILTINQPPVADASASPLLYVLRNGSNVTVILDGSRSFDPDGDPLQYTWYQAGDATPLAHAMVAATVLPVGAHSIVLSVSDGLATRTNGLVIEVLTTLQAVQHLAATVTDSVWHRKPLLAILHAALASLNRGDAVSAINRLLAFQNQVRAQVAPVDSVLAASLIQLAGQIVVALSGGEHNPAGKPQAHFTSVTRQSKGAMRMRFTAQTGGLYFIEASTNLLDWEMIGAAAPVADGVFEFEDHQATWFSSRLYRVSAP
jgi:PKD repeat protein